MKVTAKIGSDHIIQLEPIEYMEYESAMYQYEPGWLCVFDDANEVFYFVSLDGAIYTDNGIEDRPFDILCGHTVGGT